MAVAVGLVPEAVELRADLADLREHHLLVAAALVRAGVHEGALDVHVEAARAEERHRGTEHVRELDDLAALDSLTASSTSAGFIRFAEPRSSPAPQFDGQRALSGGTVHDGVSALAVTAVTASAIAAPVCVHACVASQIGRSATGARSVRMRAPCGALKTPQRACGNVAFGDAASAQTMRRDASRLSPPARRDSFIPRRRESGEKYLLTPGIRGGI